jgi:hypothetical protein
MPITIVSKACPELATARALSLSTSLGTNLYVLGESGAGAALLKEGHGG